MNANNKTGILSAVFCCLLFQAGILIPSRAALGAETLVTIDDFSLFGAMTQSVAELTADVIQLGTAQVSFQNDIAAARRDLQTGWNNPKTRDEAAARLGNLLFQKDMLYALIPISEGVNAGWERSKAFNRLSGAPLDGGITKAATEEFLTWIATLRGHLGAYENDLILMALITNPGKLQSAFQSSRPAYLNYAETRDQYELNRFLPLPAPRLAADGSAAFKKQRINVLNPYRWGVDPRLEMGTRLRALAAQGQQMLECVYGPIRAQHPEDGEMSIYRDALFWYRSAPADIKGLQELDLRGKLAGLGEHALERCPATQAQAVALQAANVARHPLTSRQNAEKEAKKGQMSEMEKQCGDDRACMRRAIREQQR